MKSHTIFSRFRVHGKILLVLVSLLMGSLLMEPVIRLLPVLANLTATKQHIDISTPSTVPFGFSPERTTTQDEQIFLPVFMTGGTLSEDTPLEQITEPKPEENKFTTIDLSPYGSLITVQITPTTPPLSAKGPVEIRFYPSDQCQFGDGGACIYEFSTGQGSRVSIASLHSGFGGEAEGFRDLIEGTGFNQALYSSDRVNQNIQDLLGSQISITQGATTLSGRTLIAIVRIPPQHMATYLDLPIEKTLEFALEINQLDPVILNQDLFVIETCGWKLPNESPIPGTIYTNFAVYLGLVQ